MPMSGIETISVDGLPGYACGDIFVVLRLICAGGAQGDGAKGVACSPQRKQVMWRS